MRWGWSARSGLARSQLPCPPEHLVQHWLGELAGEGVLLAGVIAPEQLPAAGPGLGRFSGGGQRFTAVTYASLSFSPSPRRCDSAWLANPVRCSDPNSQSPER